MKPCRECGRVNPQEAAYCMTCAAPLSQEQPRQESARTEFRQEHREYRPGGTASGAQEGRFEKVAPVVEDFVFDVMRAGARLYFGVKDPEAAQDPYRRGGDRPTKLDRVERLKDIIAEARVAHRRRGQQSDSDRARR